MYYRHKKSEARGGTIPPSDCFAEKIRSWLWILGIIVIGAIIATIVASSSQGPGGPSTSQAPSPHVGAQNVAFRQCPYCPGYHDTQGRCNVPGCPVYSPNWGMSLESQGISPKPLLIKELAMEVSASAAGGGAIIHSVYIDGNGEKAGLRAGDIIFRFNGRRVRNAEHFQSLVSQARPESNIRIQVIRNMRKIRSAVMIGEGEMEGVTIPASVNTAPDPVRGRLF